MFSYKNVGGEKKTVVPECWGTLPHMLGGTEENYDNLHQDRRLQLFTSFIFV